MPKAENLNKINELPLEERVRLAVKESFTIARQQGQADPDQLLPIFKRYDLLSSEGVDSFRKYLQAESLKRKQVHPDVFTAWNYLTKILPYLIQNGSFQRDPVFFTKAIIKRILNR